MLVLKVRNLTKGMKMKEMKDVSNLLRNNSIDTLVRDYNIDVITYKMLVMYGSDEWKNSNQPIEDLVTMDEIINIGGIDESFVKWLMEINEVYYIVDGDESYFNFGEVVDKHNWYQWCEKYGEEKVRVISGL
jgi:hypothetical protein